MNNVLVVSVHPDDETIGAGGTLLKHIAAGDKVYWIIVTSMIGGYGSDSDIQRRDSEIAAVSKAYGFAQTFALNYPTTRLSDESLFKLVPDIAKIFSEIQPHIVYTVNRSDAHSDHRVAFEAVMACTKSFRVPSVKRVLMFECLSETEFAPALPERIFFPNYFVDVTPFLSRKLEILEIFQSELGAHPFPRSEDNVKALAVFRGATAGVQYAEAFQLLKFIDK
jgi:LmbE family N-acetylglucosaminyl deacetylase